MARKRISELPLDNAVTGPDVLPIVSDGATKRVTLATLRAFFQADGPTGPTGVQGASVVGPTGPSGVSITGPAGPQGNSIVGPTGPAGVAGAAGAAASVQVGTVTTGAPGSSASVVNAGSTSAAVLNFTIPAGATGAVGATGPQGEQGPQGSPGVVSATAPLAYDEATQTVSLKLGSSSPHLVVSGGELYLDLHAAFHSASGPDPITPASIGAVADNDARLSDARQPLTHQHTASQISDFTTAVIAAAPPTVDASLLTQGTLPDARLSSNIARTSDVTAAVAAVIDAAPASLDTLKELAAALGDDANFATTVTNSLASKAPLANPTFTGTVGGITAAMVGLGNVNNTSDASKPISTAMQAALDGKANASHAHGNITSAGVLTGAVTGGVSLLLHFDGANGSTTFTDSSPSGLTVTANGDAAISTAQSTFGGASGYFDGTGDYLSINHGAAFDFDSGDFCIEAWIKRAGGKTICSGNAIGDYMFATEVFGAGDIGFGRNGVAWDLVASNPGLTSGWNHVAVARSGTTLRIFCNGAVVATGSDNSLAYNVQDTLWIGARVDAGPAEFFTGYIDELRIVKGAAVYTANFTPPTAPLPDAAPAAHNPLVVTNSSGVIVPAATIASSAVSGLAAVATSGSYADLSNKPTIPSEYTLPVATSSVLGGVKQGSNVTIDGTGVISVAAPFSGAYADLSGKPTLVTSYNDLTDKPTLFSGAYADLTGKPTLFDGSYTSLTNVPSTFAPASHKSSHATGGSDALTPADIGASAVDHTHSAQDVSGLAAVATSGAYTDLTGRPTLGTAAAAATTDFAAASHSHAASEITSGTFDAARIPSLPASQIGSGTLALARLPIVLEQTQTVGNSGTSATLALTTGSVQTVTLSGNCTFTMPSPTAGASITLILTQGGTFTATFTGVLWAGGTAPTITATSNKVDILVFVSNGTSWFGTASQNH